MNVITSAKNPIATAIVIGVVPFSVVCADNLTIEEVIVTAQKRAESLQDVPITVQAFDENTLKNTGVSDTKQLQAVTPGLVFNQAASRATPYLRGIGTRLSFIGLESSVATYVDDMYMSRPTSGVMDLADIERVEVLKGPQGTLYGRNSTGGAVRVITSKPEFDQLEGSVKATLGNYAQKNMSISVNIPLSDKLAVRLSGTHRERDGYVENTFLDTEIDDQNSEVVRAKFLWAPNDNVEVSYAIDYTEDTGTSGMEFTDLSQPRNGVPTSLIGVAFGGSAINGKNDKLSAGFDPVKDLEQVNHQLRIDWSFDHFDFASISTYSDFRNLSGGDGEGNPVALIDFVDEENSETWTQEFQLLSNGDSNLQWMAGVYLYEDNSDYEAPFAPGTAGLFQALAFGALTNAGLAAPLGYNSSVDIPTTIIPFTEVETSSWAVYGNVTYEFSEAWSLTLGGRYSYDERQLQSSWSTHSNLMFDVEDDWAEFTPSVTLQYDTEMGMYYLKYSRGYKSGGYSIPLEPAGSDVLAFVMGGAVPMTITDMPSIEPEVLDMWEFGAKVDLASNLRLNGALYYYDYQDLQVTAAANGGDGAALTLETVNAGTAEVLGLEMDLTWLPMESMTVRAGFNVMDSELDDAENLTAPVLCINSGLDCGAAGPLGYQSQVFNANGESLLRAPDFEAYLTAEYIFMLNSGAMVPVSLTYSYKDDFDFDFVADEYLDASGNSVSVEYPMEELHQDGYELINARISYISPDESYEVALWGNNLTDEVYLDEANAIASSNIRGSYAAPRTYGVDFIHNF